MIRLYNGRLAHAGHVKFEVVLTLQKCAHAKTVIQQAIVIILLKKYKRRYIFFKCLTTLNET